MASSSDLAVTGAIGGKDECGERGVLVHDGDKALFGEICNLWYHIKCQNVSAVTYGVLQKSTGVHWYCKGCDKGVSKLLQTLVQILVFIGTVKGVTRVSLNCYRRWFKCTKGRIHLKRN